MLFSLPGHAGDHISVCHVTQHVMCPHQKESQTRTTNSFNCPSSMSTLYVLWSRSKRVQRTTDTQPEIALPNIYVSISSTAEDRLQSSNTYFNEEKCGSQICYEFLDKQDLLHFTYCWKRTNLTAEPSRSVCHFLNARDRAPVALASFHGSGNTWVRGLLQAATDVCTGAIYCDTTLRRSGFPGESLGSGKTLVIKTHQTNPNYPPKIVDKHFEKKRADIPVYSSAICIIRNPLNALVAEWNRLIT